MPLLSISGTTAKMVKDIINVNSTHNLKGTALRIAYANKKYHHDTIWTGVTIGLALIRLFESPKKIRPRKTMPTKKKE